MSTIEMDQFGKIGVLMGGYSSERAISLKSGKAVVAALQAFGGSIVPLDILFRDPARIKQQLVEAEIDLAFIALHGALGEDGVIQGILEALGIPFTGSGVEANRLAIDKVATQRLLMQQGVGIPSYEVLYKKDIKGWDAAGFDDFPYIVKPAREGSSIGIRLVQTQEQLQEAVKIAWQYGQAALVEAYIKGREMTVGILDGQALPVVEIMPCHDFFDFSAKYQDGRTRYQVPARIASALAAELQRIALQVYARVGCVDLARVDFMVAPDGKPYVLEVNTIPGFTSSSLLPKAAAEQGIDFGQLCVRLIGLAHGKKKEKETPSYSY